MQLQDAGLIDVTINYRHTVVQGQGSAPRVREMGGPQVCLSVGVIRACGLKVTIGIAYKEGLKALDTIGNCQRPVFSFAVSQHFEHKITNL